MRSTRRTLTAGIVWQPSVTSEFTEWTQGIGNTDYFDDFTKDKTRRITPRYKTDDVNARFEYDDKDLFGVKDLFDSDIRTEVISEDMQSVRVEIVDNNRRLFSLGATFSF